jgi:hypothetical protein
VTDRTLVRRFWSGITPRRLAPLLAAVFFNFAVFGFLVDVLKHGAASLSTLAGVVVLSGGVAAAYLYLGIRRLFWWLPVVVVLQGAFAAWISHSYSAPGLPAGAPVASRLAVDGFGAIAFLAIGYSLFMTFIAREGVKGVRSQTEIDLAQEIHLSLVPPVALETPWCEVYGRSLPASEVGGDLVDAVIAPDRLVGVVADVSGHGVPAGTLMGLVKASVRTRLRADDDLEHLVADVNDVLVGLTQAHTFVTAAVLVLEPPGRLSYVLAGHPPILHRSAETAAVARLSRGGLALGIRPGEAYAATELSLAAGDVLAILTDGFTETMDAQDRELGLEPLERTLAAHGGEPLPVLFDRLLGVARAFGPQQDDRTLLLVRIREA